MQGLATNSRIRLGLSARSLSPINTGSALLLSLCLACKPSPAAGPDAGPLLLLDRQRTEARRAGSGSDVAPEDEGYGNKQGGHCERRPEEEALFEAETPDFVREFDRGSMREHESEISRMSAEQKVAIAIFSGDRLWFHWIKSHATQEEVAAAVRLLHGVDSREAQDRVLWYLVEVANLRKNLVAPFREEILRERPRLVECLAPKRLREFDGSFLDLARLPSVPIPE